MAYDNGKSPETLAQFLKNYSKTMYDSQHRMIPMLGCLGNHEVINAYSSQYDIAITDEGRVADVYGSYKEHSSR